MIQHPCYSDECHFKIGRIHLPVAPNCNIQCNFCQRIVSEECHVQKPGIAYRILKPNQVLDYLKSVRNPATDKIVGIAGPGEPLANEETFETFRLLAELADIELCLCTNGLLLPKNIQLLCELGVKYLTVTVNALDAEVGAKIYSRISYEDQVYTGFEAAEILIKNQIQGLELAAGKMHLKVNSVYVPGINENQLVKIAKKAALIGVDTMNIMPLIPQGKFCNLHPPSLDVLAAMRIECNQYLSQFKTCAQCRADACGLFKQELESI